MAYIIDAAVILIFVFCIWNGRRKGLVKTMSRLVSILLSVVLALLLCKPVTQWMTQKKIVPKLEQSVSQSLDEAGQDVGAGLQQAADKLPSFVKNALLNQNGTVKLTVPAETKNVARYVANDIIAPVIQPIIRVVSFLVLFLIGALVIRLVLWIVNQLCKLPGLKGLNHLAGGIAGAVEGFLWAFVLVSLLQAFAAANAPDAFLSTAVIEQTVVAKFLINLNPAGAALRKIGAAVTRL